MRMLFILTSEVTATMPPKARAPRKSINKDPASNATRTEKDVINTSTKDSDMPPPPVPLPPSGILEAEVNALGGCFRVSYSLSTGELWLHQPQNAIVKTGQVYGFYADTRRM